MRLALFDQLDAGTASAPRLGLVTTDGVIAVDTVPAPNARRALKRVIADFDELSGGLEDLGARSTAIPLDRVRLLPPLAEPTKVLCTLRLRSPEPEHADQLYTFLKAPGSVIGNGGEVVLPQLDGAEIFTHNLCLAVVIGRRCRAVAAADWREAVYGFTAMVDIAARTDSLARWNRGQSPLGSSCDAFGPLGPWIVRRTELEDGGGIELRLHCNGELRQEIRFDDLDAQIGMVVERASTVMTLEPGDVIAIDGTWEGQGPVQDGDELRVDFGASGGLVVTVRDPSGRRWDPRIRVAPADESATTSANLSALALESEP
jgi:2-keto-4-pentenoate hydratase/2-oxohepta-3-ene-1,7-dioic acid hydratase in catechol pathway